MNYTQQLNAIIKAAGWTQEQLAHELGVSFATLNSWVNARSAPRTKAATNIDRLFLNIVGASDVREDDLNEAKDAAISRQLNPRLFVENKETRDRLTLYMTYHTNTIEGSTMTLADVGQALFEQKVLINRTVVEQAEARNHQAVLHWLLRELADKQGAFVITPSLIRETHLRLMNGILSDAGEYRQHAVRITGTRVVLANWIKIPELVDGVAVAMNESTNDTVATLARTHALFEQIHPFSDGNGRVGRLLLLVQALRLGIVPPLVLKERRYAYYKYLEFAQTLGDSRLLELFVAESIQATDKILSL